MAMYLKIIYPLIGIGKSHTRPTLPECCINIYEVSVTWDIHSVNEDDRAEYWEVDQMLYDNLLLPPLVDAATVETAVYGNKGKVQYLIDNPPTYIQ